MKVRALVNSNPEFPENAHAIEIVNEMVTDAKCQCIRLAGRAEAQGDTKLENYIDAKIRTYEAIEETLA